MPSSSPSSRWRGRSAARRAAIAASAPRSSAVTSVWLAFQSYVTSRARERRQRDGVGEVGELQRQGQLAGHVHQAAVGQCSASSSSVRMRSGRPYVIVEIISSAACGLLGQLHQPGDGAGAVVDDAVRRHRPGDVDVGVHGRLVGRQQRRAGGSCGCRGSARRAGPARCSACSASSAASTPAVTIVYGSASSGDGRNALAVQLAGLERRRRHVEVVGEPEAEAELAGDLGRVAARAEQHDLRARRRRRRGPEPRPRALLDALVAEQAHQVEEVAGEVLGAEHVRRRGAARRPSPDRCRAPGRCRGRRGRGAAPRAWRTARRRRAARGSGSITPPEPMRIDDVDAPRWAISTGGDVLATVAMLWCSATQKRQVAELLGPLGERRGVGERLAGRAAGADGGQVEDRAGERGIG